MRLWFDGVLAVDRWVAQFASTYSWMTPILEAGKSCKVVIEHYERQGAQPLALGLWQECKLFSGNSAFIAGTTDWQRISHTFSVPAATTTGASLETKCVNVKDGSRSIKIAHDTKGDWHGVTSERIPVKPGNVVTISANVRSIDRKVYWPSF